MKTSSAISPPITLIFDKEVSGHHLDYIEFLVMFLKKKDSKTRDSYLFVLNEAAAARFKKDESLIRFHYIATDWMAQPTGKVY